MNMDWDRFSDPGLAERLAARIRSLCRGRFHIMEVCGTHTMAIARYGLREMLPTEIELISGPGCPVCVTAQEDIDRMVAISKIPGAVLATFGDMVRVPGSRGSLAQARAQGADVRVVYSCLDAVDLAESLPDRKIVFAGVGFETTSPTVAAAVVEARERRLKNFSVYPAFKLVPPALRLVLSSPRVRIDGFLLPGHVSAVIGIPSYRFIAEEYGRPGAVAGFEPLDILGAVALILEMHRDQRPDIKNEYTRGVRPEGNPEAIKMLYRVFQPATARWRALGELPESGLKFRPEYRDFDASLIFPLQVDSAPEPEGCGCGQVMMGMLSPDQCPLFAQRCTPEEPVGPCMVSAEGACAAWYRYGLGRRKG